MQTPAPAGFILQPGVNAPPDQADAFTNALFRKAKEAPAMQNALLRVL
jgi:hypothetical protein